MKKLQLLLWCLFLVACASGPTEAQTVFITRTGAKYHTGDCRYLHSSKIPISLKEAGERGYTACSVCRPRSLSTEQNTARDADDTGASQGSSTESYNRPAETSGTTYKQNTSSSSSQCSATTKAGSRCKRAASGGSDRCWQHQ